MSMGITIIVFMKRKLKHRAGDLRILIVGLNLTNICPFYIILY